MLSLQSRALNSMQSPLPQADGPVGRQARALGQDAAGRRYYLLGGDMGTTRVFVDSGPAAEHTALGTAGDDELVGAGMQRISSFASDIQGSGVAAPQQPQQSAPLQQLSNPTDPAEGAWGWYEADQLPALLEWLEGGDEGERALADALFEAMLPLLPASLASTAPSQARTNSFARTETKLCLPGSNMSNQQRGLSDRNSQTRRGAKQSLMMLCIPAQAQAHSLAANRVWAATETALPVVAQPAPGSAPPGEPADGYLSAVPLPAPKDQLRKVRSACRTRDSCSRVCCTCDDSSCM